MSYRTLVGSRNPRNFMHVDTTKFNRRSARETGQPAGGSGRERGAARASGLRPRGRPELGPVAASSVQGAVLWIHRPDRDACVWSRPDERDLARWHHARRAPVHDGACAGFALRRLRSIAIRRVGEASAHAVPPFYRALGPVAHSLGRTLRCRVPGGGVSKHCEPTRPAAEALQRAQSRILGHWPMTGVRVAPDRTWIGTGRKRQT